MPETRVIFPEIYQRRAARSARLARALWRNTRVVLREFRTPILVFVLAVFVGGWVYGELWVRAGHPRIPYVDLPYTMLALMIFESPTDLPAEWQLVAFWYLMPLVAAYVAGRGVFEFATLFFSTGDSPSSWEKAVASSYGNHVIVLGVGHLGLRVVRALVAMGVEVVAIDYHITPDKVAELRGLHVPVVQADGRLASTLESAAIREAQALIVCTSNDHMNLEVTMRARDLNPEIRIVVRVWDDQFAAQIRRFMNAEAVLSATNLAAPSFASSALGIEITQTLTVNGEDFSMIRLQVAPGTFLDGATVGALQDEHEMDVVLHANADTVDVHPAPGRTIHAGDTLIIFARHSKITDVVARNRRVAAR